MQAVEILAVMVQDPTAEYYGLDLGKRVGVLTGTVYPLLRRLEDAGWLVSAEEEIDPAVAGRLHRRLYHSSDRGLGSTVFSPHCWVRPLSRTKANLDR